MGLFNDAKSANRWMQKGMGEAQNAYGDVQGMYQPYSEGGGQAFSTMGNLMGQNGQQAAHDAFATFQQDPGYQWQQDQGIQAIDRSASAGLKSQSGGTLKALQRYGQGLADQSYNQWYGRLGDLANTGMQATGQVANARSNLGNQLMQGNAQIGQNKANQSNAQLGMLGNLMGGVSSFFKPPGM